MSVKSVYTIVLVSMRNDCLLYCCCWELFCVS